MESDMPPPARGCLHQEAGVAGLHCPPDSSERNYIPELFLCLRLKEKLVHLLLVDV